MALRIKKKLLGSGNGEEAGGADDHQDDGGDGVLCQKEDGQKRETHDALRGSGNFAGAIAVGEMSASQIACEHAETGQHHEKRHLRWLEARDGGHEWIDVTEPAECATVAQCRGKEDEPGNRRFEKMELSGKTGIGQRRHGWYPAPEQVNEDKGPEGDQHEGEAPGKAVADRRAKGNAENVGYRHSCDHDGNGLCAPAFVGQFVGHDGTDPEECAVGQPEMKRVTSMTR